MIDFRIYRAGFAPAVAAVVVLLFALTAPPDPLPTTVTPAEFDGRTDRISGREAQQAAAKAVEIAHRRDTRPRRSPRSRP